MSGYSGASLYEEVIVSVGMTIVIVVIVLAAAVAAVAGGIEYYRRRLRAMFGPEYERLERENGRWDAFRELQRRRRAYEGLKLRGLSAEDQERFTTEWRAVQSGFVDDPRGALEDAGSLVSQLLAAAGYPDGDENDRLALLSVDHARALDGYRAARDLTRRAAEDADADLNTEDLRAAILGYRTLFNGLLAARTPRATPTPPAPAKAAHP